MAKKRAAKKKAASSGRTADRIADAAAAVAAKMSGGGSAASARDVEAALVRVPTGSASLDSILDGGWVMGRVYELYGKESAGKTTLALTAIREVQAAGGIAGYVDAEHAMDWGYARRIGVDVDKTVVVLPKFAEDAMSGLREMARAGVDVAVVDTVAALSPRPEMEGEFGDQHVGLQARLMSKACRMLATDVRESGMLLIFVNQLRTNIGVTYGNPETTPGGKALKYYASTRLEVRPGSRIERGDEVVGRWCRVYVEKSKTSIPFRRAEFPIVFGVGIHAGVEATRLAIEAKIVEKSGSWYSWGDIRAQGEQGFADAIESAGKSTELAKAVLER